MVLCRIHELNAPFLLPDPIQGTLYGSIDHEIRYRHTETNSQSLPVGKFGVFTIVGSVDNYKTGECFSLRRRRQLMTKEFVRDQPIICFVVRFSLLHLLDRPVARSKNGFESGFRQTSNR